MYQEMINSEKNYKKANVIVENNLSELDDIDFENLSNHIFNKYNSKHVSKKFTCFFYSGLIVGIASSRLKFLDGSVPLIK